MSNLRRLGSQFSISLPPDEEGLIGRECPVPECEGYFKIQPGTGLKGDNLSCNCPYCGHKAGPDKFFTKAQVEYAKSVVLRQVTGALLKDLKALEFNHRPRGGFGIGISMTVNGQQTPIRQYREKKLETEVVCTQCTLCYTIYGVFGFCPDCAAHNSLQILNANLELVEKLLIVADSQEPRVAKHLTENALEDCVSSFDGFGRETCRVFSSKGTKPEKVAEIRFQNIVAARTRVKDLYAVDFAANSAPDDWLHVLMAFQKRHLLAHKMGVVDEEYLSATGDSQMQIGRKITVTGQEVRELIVRLKKLSEELYSALEAKK